MAGVLYVNWVEARDWPWEHFSPKEMRCRGSDALLVVPEFMDGLETLRTVYGTPMTVSSGYRSPAHNAAVSSTGTNGPHTTGRAVDILVHGMAAHRLIALAMQQGHFTGIGVSQKGAHGARFVHLDNLPNAPGQPRPWIWSY